MLHKLVVIVVVAAFVNLTIGCSSKVVVAISKADVATKPEKITSLTRTDGKVIQYDKTGGGYHLKYHGRVNVVVGLTEKGDTSVTPIDSVLEARVQRTEVNTVGTIIMVTILAAAIIWIIVEATNDDPPPAPRSTGTQSCPFFYSYDGQAYQFDAEPLGGSTTEGLRRTDYSRLEHLVPAEGEYRLLVRNENPETQFIDEAKLLVIDHAPGAGLAPDYAGNFRSYTRTIGPSSVVDEDGRDLRVFFASRDDVRWQTAMPTDTSFRGWDERHHLTLTFPKPKGTSTLSLCVNAGTATWGSRMVREMLMMRGDKLDDWYRDVDAGGVEMQRLAWFMDREELFTLKVNVLEGGAWVRRGTIHGGGPMADDDRILDLDVSGVEGDTVRVQINPPRGYWKIDCINAVEGVAPVATVTELAAASARDQSGKDVAPLLKTNDSSYYAMPETGNQCDLRFTVPGQAEGTSRTIYLKSAGYYRLHLPKDTPEQTAFIWEMGMNPGTIVRYSLEKYYEYRQQALSSLSREQ